MANLILEKHGALKRRHYLLLANQVTHWFNASPNVIAEYRAQYGDDFCVVLWRNGSDNDAYVIPFQTVKSLFSNKNLVGGTGAHRRWHGGIKGSHLSLRGTDESVYVADCYNAFDLLQP
jgi:hypothetical protein